MVKFSGIRMQCSCVCKRVWKTGLNDESSKSHFVFKLRFPRIEEVLTNLTHEGAFS
jgi:hypothetical protein